MQTGVFMIQKPPSMKQTRPAEGPSRRRRLDHERVTQGKQLACRGKCLNWSRSSVRARRALEYAAVAALVCIGVSVLFLTFAGSKEADKALARATGAWSRVEPLIKQGPLP